MADPLASEEWAKAAQELAKIGGKAIDATTKAGAFIAKVLGGPLVEISGQWTDSLRIRRQVNVVRAVSRAHEELRALGIDEPNRMIPLNVGVPLLESASLEENEDLQGKWASLLANFIDGGSGVQPLKVYVNILDQLDPLSARILDNIYRPSDAQAAAGETSAPLPLTAKFPPGPHQVSADSESKPLDPNVQIALANLVRLSLMRPRDTYTFDGKASVTVLDGTVLGRAFNIACSSRRK